MYLDVRWWLFWMVSPNRRGGRRECGCSAYMMPWHKEAVIDDKSEYFTKEQWEEFQRSSYCFTQMEGCRAICMVAWPKGKFRWYECVALVDMHHYCAFPCPWCHQELLHLVKMTLSSWHSVLPINLSSHNISTCSRITHFFVPKILHLNHRNLLRCVTH